MQKKTALIRDGSTGPLGMARRPAAKQAIVATAAALALMGIQFDAQALALGAITVRSSLGEPLRAEIEIPQISSEEASTFQASVGSPQAFRTAGVDYNPALAGARVTLHRRADGQAYLRVVGDRPVNEPFLGVVIEANWASGRIVRDYTMLIDPPQQKPPTAVVAAPAQAPQPTRPAVAEQVTPPAPAPARAAEAPRPTPAPSASTGGEQITVQRGDTASGILRAHAIEGVSLDQMLVALLQANPKAFIRGNVNLVKAGAVLQLPTAEQAQAVTRANARRMVLAQSRDFQAYRRGLAQAAPATDATAAASRSASGSVQADVRDTQAPPPSSDQLKISKAGASTEAAAESQTALSRQAQEQAERVAELNKNISELSRLQSASGAGAATSPATSSAAPGIDVPVAATAPAAPAEKPDTPPASASEAAPPAPATTEASPTATTIDQAPASQEQAPAPATEPAAAQPAANTDTAATPAPSPAPTAAASAPAPAPAPAPEPSFLDTLTDDPLLPIGGAALIALLAGYGFYRTRQRKNKEASLDSEFIESRMQPDSFFGASGGQRVNTQEAGASQGGASSMSYSPSQLDAAGDVDPVAEADVYLAYGRDSQAEDILKEALLTHPGRTSIHRKLAEIYGKRRDPRALEAIATEAHGLTHGEGPDWQVIATVGAELDPDNPLYKPGGAPRNKSAPVTAERRQFGADTEPQSAQVVLSKEPESTARSPLDLDVGATRQPPLAEAAKDEDTGGAPLAAAAAAAASTVVAAAAAASKPAAAPSKPASDLVDLDLGMDFAPPSELPKAGPASQPASEPAVGDSGMIEFDMSALSVDPDSRSGAHIQTEQPEDADDNPLSTKLALAQEFRSIGDIDGARNLAQEVAAEASGALKIKAERFLGEL